VAEFDIGPKDPVAFALDLNTKGWLARLTVALAPMFNVDPGFIVKVDPVPIVKEEPVPKVKSTLLPKVKEAPVDMFTLPVTVTSVPTVTVGLFVLMAMVGVLDVGTTPLHQLLASLHKPEAPPTQVQASVSVAVPLLPVPTQPDALVTDTRL
jgi:hypothetical protein